MDNRPIGFFDSGIGGLSTLSEAAKILQKEQFIYYADTLHAPFGKCSANEILRYALAAMHYFDTQHVKAAVIACNTATGVGAEKLRTRFSFPIFGIEPAVKPALAAEGAKAQPILCLTTTVTKNSQAFLRLIATCQAEHKVAVCDMPDLAEVIEQHFCDKPRLQREICMRLRGHAAMHYSAVILGCTHYVLCKEEISAALGYIKTYDGNQGICRHLKRTLDTLSLCNDSKEQTVRIVATDLDKCRQYASIMSDILPTCRYVHMSSVEPDMSQS